MAINAYSQMFSYYGTQSLLNSLSSSSAYSLLNAQSSATQQVTPVSDVSKLLSDFYASLLNQNKAADTNYDSALLYSGKISGQMNDLKNAANALKYQTPYSSDASISVGSSDEDAMTITAKAGASSYIYSSASMNIKQLASTQTTTTKHMTSKQLDFEQGVFEFSISSYGQQPNKLSVDVNEGDTNKTVLTKVAEAINEQHGSTVSASVKTSEKGSFLVIESLQTGTLADGANHFEAILNLGETTSQATDAIYSFNNGADKTSKTNEVVLNNSLTATLKNVTDQPVELTFKRDYSNAVQSVEKFVDAYNALLETADDNRSSSLGAATLTKELMNLSHSYSYLLKPMGITSGVDGKLSVNKDEAAKSIESGAFARAFQSSVNGLGGKINSITSQSNRSKYVDKVDYLSTYNYNSMLTNYNLFNSGNSIFSAFI